MNKRTLLKAILRTAIASLGTARACASNALGAVLAQPAASGPAEPLNHETREVHRRVVSLFDFMTDEQRDDVLSTSPTLDMARVLETAFNDPRDLFVNAGTYLIGPEPITMRSVAHKRIDFRPGAQLRWHSSAEFAAMRSMVTIEHCQDLTFTNLSMLGANAPAQWTRTEKIIRHGLVDKQVGALISGSTNITFEGPSIHGFQFGIYTLSTQKRGSTSKIRIQNGTFTGNYCGITWESYIVNGISDCQVLNTRATDNWRWGMWMESGSVKNGQYINRIRTIGGEYSRQVEEHGVYVQGQHHTFAGVKFENNNSAGLRMLACAGLRITDCQFLGNGWNRNGVGYSSSAAFIGDETSTRDYDKRSDGAMISGNNFVGNRQGFVDYKLDSGVSVVDNRFEQNGDMSSDGVVVFRSNSNSSVARNVFTNNGAKTAILIRDHGDSPSGNIEVTNNMIRAQAGDGIAFEWAVARANFTSLKISKNTAYGCHRNGIFLNCTQGSATDIAIEENECVENCGSGIAVHVSPQATLNLLRITGNRISRNRSVGIRYEGLPRDETNPIVDQHNVLERNSLADEMGHGGCPGIDMPLKGRSH
jgi:hypothetical protein